MRPEERIPARTGGARCSFRRWQGHCGYATLFLPRLSNSQGTAVVNPVNDYSDSDQRPQSSPPLRGAASTETTKQKSGPTRTVVHQNLRLTWEYPPPGKPAETRCKRQDTQKTKIQGITHQG